MNVFVIKCFMEVHFDTSRSFPLSSTVRLIEKIRGFRSSSSWVRINIKLGPIVNLEKVFEVPPESL
jgi:hypothetical protein